MRYVYFSDGTDNGKSFTNVKEALEYLYQSALHVKRHENGKLKDIKLTDNSFSLLIEKTNFLLGTYVEEIGIRTMFRGDIKLVNTYFEINKCY